jgi:hypothetical protein
MASGAPQSAMVWVNATHALKAMNVLGTPFDPDPGAFPLPGGSALPARPSVCTMDSVANPPKP